MLPIYEAVSFQRVMSGGRTNPWLVLVNVNGQEKPYVVKLFNEIENDRREVICKEVLGNALASEFGLIAPKAALIEMDYDFETTINDPNATHSYEFADQRLKFATELIHPFLEFTAGAYKSWQIKKSIEIDSLFAFDNLIKNSDRGQARPNILLQDKKAYLIDHELAFNIDGGTINDIITKNWDANIYKRHIFYNYLKSSIKTTKTNYFVEFDEYLKYIDVKKFDGHLLQLRKEGYITKHHEYVLEYLENVRKNSGNFVQLLQGLIT